MLKFRRTFSPNLDYFTKIRITQVPTPDIPMDRTSAQALLLLVQIKDHLRSRSSNLDLDFRVTFSYNLIVLMPSSDIHSLI